MAESRKDSKRRRNSASESLHFEVIKSIGRLTEVLDSLPKTTTNAYVDMFACDCHHFSFKLDTGWAYVINKDVHLTDIDVAKILQIIAGVSKNVWFVDKTQLNMAKLFLKQATSTDSAIGSSFVALEEQINNNILSKRKSTDCKASRLRAASNKYEGNTKNKFISTTSKLYSMIELHAEYLTRRTLVRSIRYPCRKDSSATTSLVIQLANIVHCMQCFHSHLKNRLRIL